MQTRRSALLLLASIGVLLSACAASTSTFRKPFTLTLYIDKVHFYEERFEQIPFVHDGNVYLFKGDQLGLDLDSNSVRSVKQQPNLQQADVTLNFTQEISGDGSAMMLLRIHNNTKHTINIDALMTVPGKKEVLETSILPVPAGLSSFESWPHPIVQLVLRNIRIAK